MCSEKRSDLATESKKPFNQPKLGGTPIPYRPETFWLWPSKLRAKVYRMAAKLMSEQKRPCLVRSSVCPIGSVGCMGTAISNAAVKLGLVELYMSPNVEGNRPWSALSTDANNTQEAMAWAHQRTGVPPSRYSGVIQEFNDNPNTTLPMVISALRQLAFRAEHGGKSWTDKSTKSSKPRQKPSHKTRRKRLTIPVCPGSGEPGSFLPYGGNE